MNEKALYIVKVATNNDVHGPVSKTARTINLQQNGIEILLIDELKLWWLEPALSYQKSFYAIQSSVVLANASLLAHASLLDIHFSVDNSSKNLQLFYGFNLLNTEFHQKTSLKYTKQEKNKGLENVITNKIPHSYLPKVTGAYTIQCNDHTNPYQGGASNCINASAQITII